MRHACDAAMPRISPGQWKKKATYWWSDTIECKRKECIALHRKWMRYKSKYNNSNIYHESTLETNFKRAKKDLRLLIRKAKALAWQNLIRIIDEDPWGLPYRLVTNKLRRNAPRITEMLEANVLNNTLDELFPKARAEKGRIAELEENWREDWDISPMEIYRIIKKRPTKNAAPGLDGVKSSYWKQIDGEMIACVASVLTLCLRQGVFPIQWKQAQLVLLPKGELDLHKSKVRPICLLPEIGKIFERVIAERLWDWMDTHADAALSPNQFGFRHQRSTIDAIVELREFIEFAHKENGTVIAVALDISNAFNSLQWADICRALRDKKFQIYLQRLIYDYLSKRTILYTDENGKQVSRRIEAGVPQGSVLGPLLWNITFDKDISAKAYNGCRLMAYADDTLVVTTGESVNSARRRAEFQTARTCKHIKNLNLEVSAMKTEVIVFTPDKRPPPVIEVIVSKQKVQSKRSIKYLGVIMDDKLQFTEHMEYVEKKTKKVTRNLWRLMPNLHGPSEKRRRLYANVISSIVLYAAPIWKHKATQKGKVHGILKELHRNVVLRVIAAYKTVSHDAAAIISRIPPYHYTAESRKKSYSDQIRSEI